MIVIFRFFRCEGSDDVLIIVSCLPLLIGHLIDDDAIFACRPLKERLLVGIW